MNRKVLFLTVTNALLILVYVVFSYVPAADLLRASALVDTWHASAVTPQDITAVQAASFTTLDPVVLDATDRIAIGLAYEPLVRFGAFFNIKPALAYSWYWRDTTHFVTLLRPHVVFHDGSAFACADVAATLTRAQQHPLSTLRDNFADVTVSAESDACVFSLPKPDHTFAHKLTQLFIVPHTAAEQHARDVLADMTGTGRYRLVAHEKTKLLFDAFDRYYGLDANLPKHVTLSVEPKKYNRLTLVREGAADILLDTPPMFATQIEKRMEYRVTSVPTYESTFLLFNQHTTTFADRTMRAQLANMIRTVDVAALLNDAGVYDLAQFAPAGVFGFDPTLAASAHGDAVSLADPLVLTLGVTEGNRKIAEILQTQLKNYNVEIKPRILSDADLADALKGGILDLYIIGWRYDLGTVDSFYRKVVHSSHGSYGDLAGFGYASTDVDARIEQAIAEPNSDQRLLEWQKLMSTIVKDDVIGVPLLGTRQLYATRPSLTTFTPRMDGLMLFESTSQP